MYDLTNAVYTEIKSAVTGLYPSAKVVKPFQAQTTTFPYVTVQGINNVEIERTLDWKEQKSQYSCQIEVYMNGGSAETTAKKIVSAIIDVMENEFHMMRKSAGPVVNSADTTIYRYVLRYQCNFDEDSKKIY